MGCCCVKSYTQERTTKYDEIKQSLKTGDIVLFSGMSPMSNIVKCSSSSQWSHIGMVVRLGNSEDRLKIRDPDGLYLWHSNSDSIDCLPDVISGVPKTGCQLSTLGKAIRCYTGTCVLRQLSDPFYDDQGLVKEFIFKEAHKNYEKNTCELFLSVYDGPCGRNKKNTEYYFCSELVAQTYMVMGLLKDQEYGIPSNEYLPRDFSEDSVLELLSNYTLLEEFMLLPPSYKKAHSCDGF